MRRSAVPDAARDRDHETAACSTVPVYRTVGGVWPPIHHTYTAHNRPCMWRPLVSTSTVVLLVEDDEMK